MSLFRAYSVIALFLVHPSLASARGEGGFGTHGGEVIVCTDQAVDENGSSIDPSRGPVVIQSIRLLDYWEGEQNTRYRLRPMSPVFRWEMILADLIVGLKNFDPARGEKIFDEFLSMHRHFAKVESSRMPRIKDSHPRAPIPGNCYLRQAAVFRRAENPIDLESVTEYRVDREIFDSPLFSHHDRAGLLFHELIYRYFVDQYAATTSDQVRPYNFGLSTDFFLPWQATGERGVMRVEFLFRYLDLLYSVGQPAEMVFSSPTQMVYEKTGRIHSARAGSRVYKRGGGYVFEELLK